MKLIEVAVVGALVGALAAGGCARAKARTLPEPPPAPVSAPPPLPARAMGQAVLAAPPDVEPAPVGEWLAEPVEPVDRPLDEPERPTETPARPAQPGDLPRLGTPETADAAAAIERVEAMLARARASLAKVNADRLTGDSRVQYQTARLLIEQAEAAVKARNFMYAARLADKAETLARQLEKS